MPIFYLFYSFFYLTPLKTTTYLLYGSFQMPRLTLGLGHFTLQTSHFTLQMRHSMLQIRRFTLQTSHFTLQMSHSKLRLRHFTLQISRSTHRLRHFTLCLSHPKPPLPHSSHFTTKTRRTTKIINIFYLSLPFVPLRFFVVLYYFVNPVYSVKKNSRSSFFFSLSGRMPDLPYFVFFRVYSWFKTAIGY